MKLKLVVASMSVLGLISCPVLAASTQTTTTQNTTTIHHRHIHHTPHHVHHQHVVKSQQVDYKQMGSLPVQPAPVMEVLPHNDPLMGIYEAMGQNAGRSKPMPDWFNRIGVSGGANMDYHTGNQSFGYAGENNKHLSINDVYLNVTATINDWTRAFVSLSYNNASMNMGNEDELNSFSKRPKAGVYSAAYVDNQRSSLSLEQAYIAFANFDESPFFLQAGKQFEDFGRYTIHPITRSMTQSMSETLRTSVNVGFLTHTGFHGSLYTFDNNMRPGTFDNETGEMHVRSKNRVEYGASLGFDQVNDQLGYNLGVGYLSNMTGVNDINYAVGYYNYSGNNGYYIHRVAGLAAYANVNSGPFTLGAHYVTALSKFHTDDLPNVYQTNFNDPGAKPWSADITAGFGFTNFTYGLNTLGKNQNLYVGYSASGDAVNLFLPKNRWTVGYNVDMWAHSNVGLEVNHDTDYSLKYRGNNRSSNTIAARASVKFG